MNECKYCSAPCGDDVCYTCAVNARCTMLEKQLDQLREFKVRAEQELDRVVAQRDDAEDKLGACVDSVNIWQDMQEQSAKRAKLWKRLAKAYRAQRSWLNAE